MHWLQFGTLTLYTFDKEDLVNGKWLTDMHINAVQYLLKFRFPHIDLHNTLNICRSGPAKIEIQILHIDENHWITVSTSKHDSDGADVIVYDSKYSSLSDSTTAVLAKLIRSQ